MTTTGSRNLTKYIIGFLKEYGDFPVEHAICIKDGNTVFETLCGEKTQCDLSGCDEDGDIIHNHPTSPPILSQGDITTAAGLNAKSITAVSKKYKSWWTLKRPRGGWEEYHSSRVAVKVAFDASLDIMRVANMSLLLDLKKSVDRGDITNEDAIVMLHGVQVETALELLKLKPHLIRKDVPKSALDEGSAAIETLGLIGILVIGVASIVYIAGKRT